MAVSLNLPRFARSIPPEALCPALLAVCLASCSQAEPRGLPDDIEWHSEHFVYHARAGDADVCPALLERMERHFAAIHAAVGLPWPEGRVIHYYKFLDENDYQEAAGCPEDTDGCARDGAAYAFAPLYEHELIHTYFEPLGSPPRLLSEGVAELLSCDLLDLVGAAVAEMSAAGNVYTGDIELYNPDRDSPYLMGSILVSHLVRTYGWEAFLDLYSKGWNRRDATEVEQNFQALYGASFDALWTTAIRTGLITSCVAAWACAAEPLAPGSAETPSDTCGESQFRSVSASAPEVLQLEADGAADGAVTLLLACPADPGEPISGPFAEVGTRTLADLVSGKYLVATGGDTTVTSQRVDDSMFGTECDQLRSFALAADAEETLLFEPRTEPYFLRLGLPVDARLVLSIEGAGPIQICPSCAVTDDCVTVEEAGTFAARSGAVFHLPAMAQPGQLARLALGTLAAPGMLPINEH